MSSTKKEMVDDDGDPTWLSAKQKHLYGQLMILKSLDDDLIFNVVEHLGSPPTELHQTRSA